MSIEAMRQALDALEEYQAKGPPFMSCDAAVAALRAAIEQAEKPVAWMYTSHWKGDQRYITRYQYDLTTYKADKVWPLYTAPRQEQYDQTALELCKECGWRALIPGDGCLVCARQKAQPVAWMYDFMADNRDEVIRDWVTQSQDDIKRENGFNVRPLYTAPRQWVELTDDEARALVNRATFGDRTNWQALVYMVDAKLKEKNA